MVVSFGTRVNSLAVRDGAHCPRATPGDRQAGTASGAAVDDPEIALDVALEVIDGYAQGLGRLLLVEGETGHLPTEALASSVTVESTRAHMNQISKNGVLLERSRSQ